jgi:hypothetical protein
MEAEGELYRLQECAVLAIQHCRKLDWFIDLIVKLKGVGPVSKTLTDIIREKCGNENSGTFTITTEQLDLALVALRKFYFSQTFELLLASDKFRLSLDREGQICFELIQPRKDGEKGGGREPEKP